MRIRDFRREVSGGGARATARVEWEDAGRAPRTVAFEAGGELAGRLEPTAEAFVLAAATAAARAGERRIRVDGSICPVFTDGLRSGLALLDSWYGGSRARLRIEAAGGFRASRRANGPAAFFFSGGVDSLYVLRRNRLDVSRAHPKSFRVGIHLRAFSFVEGPVDDASRNIFLRAKRSITRIAEEEDLSLLFVESDARLLDPDRSLFGLEAQSAHLAAAAHLFPGALKSAAIAPSVHVSDTVPWGTHPILDPLYSSSIVSISHEADGCRRVERVAELSRSEIALEWMQVCGETPIDPSLLNCGKCEKCVRTMCELLAAGALARTPAFPIREVSANTIRNLPIARPDVATFWKDLRLALAGRADLVSAIDEWILRLRRSEDWLADRGWKGRLRKIDRALFRGTALALRRRWSAQP
jgi:hypothetical protein